MRLPASGSWPRADDRLGDRGGRPYPITLHEDITLSPNRSGDIARSALSSTEMINAENDRR